VYTQAISPAKHAAQAAVLNLVFAPETNSAPELRTSEIVRATYVKTAPIDEKRCKMGAIMHPFAPTLVAAKFAYLFWNEWRGRRDSNPRPLP